MKSRPTVATPLSVFVAPNHFEEKFFAKSKRNKNRALRSAFLFHDAPQNQIRSNLGLLAGAAAALPDARKLHLPERIGI